MSPLRKIALALAGLASALVTGAVYFLSAGRWDLPFGWAVVAVVGSMSVAGMFSPSNNAREVELSSRFLQQAHPCLPVCWAWSCFPLY